jgi:hypothetical protein
MNFQSKPSKLLTKKELDKLRLFLNHRRLGKRLKTIRLLKTCPDQQASLLLIRSLRNSRDQVREAAFRALVAQKTQAIALLIQILERPYDITQKDLDDSLAEYAQLLEGKRPEEGVLKTAEIGALLSALKEDAYSAPQTENAPPESSPADLLRGLLIDREYKWKAAAILGEIGDSAVIAFRMKVLFFSNSFFDNSVPPVRQPGAVFLN